MSCHDVNARSGTGRPHRFREHYANSHGNGTGQTSQNADGVELRIGTKHEKSYSDNAEGACDEGDTSETFAQQNRSETDSHEGLDGAERRRDSAWESERGVEEQSEEPADVQCAEHGSLDPPCASWSGPGDECQADSGGQRP